MLYSFRFLLFLINIDQTTILNWADVDLETILDTQQNVNAGNSIYSSIGLMTSNFCQSIQDGLKLSDIENIVFFLVFIRFIILILRYNLKTSTYITCIGIFASYLWYRHLIDIVTMYSQMLIKIPYLQKLGVNAVELNNGNDSLLNNDVKLGSDVRWYKDPGKFIYYLIKQKTIRTDLDTGLKYYIDPFSKMISNLDEDSKARILPYYYTTYNIIIPRFVETVSEFWGQLSGIAAYAIITRIGKRFCPYLIRWHWTFLLIIGFLEQILIYFLFRIMYFQQVIIKPNLVYTVVTKAAGHRTVSTSITDSGLLLQFNFLNILLTSLIVVHLGSLLFGLLHALWGQYFYFPFLVENTELHIGPRPKNSIYSGGKTAWQDEKQANPNQKFTLTKIWYGWLGNGTSENWITGPLKQFVTTNLKKFLRFFKK